MPAARRIHDVVSFEASYTQAIDYDSRTDGQPVYIGYAAPGSGKGETRWSIKKLTYDADGNLTDLQWASGSTGFVFEWDERATYTYS